CDSRDYIERRGVYPVEVFQDQQQWHIRRNRFQQFADLPYHSFAGGAENITLQALSLFRWDKRRELNQPCGRQRSPFVCRMSAFRLAKQLSDRFEQRVICFLSAEPLNALSPRNAEAGTSHYTAAERVNQRRFADTRIACDKDHLPLTAKCLSEILFQPRQADLATDELTVGIGGCV